MFPPLNLCEIQKQKPKVFTDDSLVREYGGRAKDMSSQKTTHEWLLQTKPVQSLSTGTQTECPTTNSAKTEHYARAQRWQGPKEIGALVPSATVHQGHLFSGHFGKMFQAYTQPGTLTSWVNMNEAGKKSK